MIIDNSIVKELCPYCKGDISNMTYRDSIRRENAGELGVLNIFKCPCCSKEFSCIEVVYEIGLPVGNYNYAKNLVKLTENEEKLLIECLKED